jgi:hypothetical protein
VCARVYVCERGRQGEVGDGKPGRERPCCIKDLEKEK